jgi:hypothetical protein
MAKSDQQIIESYGVIRHTADRYNDQFENIMIDDWCITTIVIGKKISMEVIYGELYCIMHEVVMDVEDANN